MKESAPFEGILPKSVAVPPVKAKDAPGPPLDDRVCFAPPPANGTYTITSVDGQIDPNGWQLQV